MIQLRKFSLFVLFLVLGLSPPTYATTPYIVGIYENPPLAFTENNEPKGFLVELLEYVAREEGWELTFIKCDWSECLDNLEKGFIDFLLPLAFSPQRAERFDFGKTNLLINWGELYCRKNVTLNSITDLEGKTIAIVPKGIYAEAFQNMISNLGISNVNYVMANDHEEVFRLISDHRVEAGVASRFAGFAFLDRYPEVGRTIITFSPTGLRIAATKGKHIYFLNRLDEKIETLKKDSNSIYYRLAEIWIFKSPSRIKKWIYWLVIGSLLISAVMLVIIVALRSIIAQKTKTLYKTIENLNNELRKNEHLRQTIFEQNQFSQSLIENIQTGIVVCDGDGKILNWNTKAIKWLKDIKEAESNGSPVWQIFPEASSEKLEQAFECVLQGYDQQIEIEFTQDSPAIAQVSLRRIVSQNVYVLILIQDITKLKEAIRYHEGRWSFLQQIVDKMPLPLFIIDSEGKVTVWNDASERLTGMSRKDVLHRSLDLSPLFLGGKKPVIPASLLINLEPAEIEELSNGIIKMSTEFPEAVETTGWIWAKEEKRYVKILASRLRDDKGNIIGYFQCARDITGEIHLQKSLAEAQKAETISHLTSVFTHELNNILTIILGLCDMISINIGQSHQIESYLNLIKDTVNRGATISNYFQKMGQKDESFVEKRSFNELVQEVLSPLIQLLSDNATIECSFDPQVGSVRVRRTEFEAVVFRLLVGDRQELMLPNKISLKTKRKRLRSAFTTPEVRIPPGTYSVLSITYEADEALSFSNEEPMDLNDLQSYTHSPAKSLGIAFSKFKKILFSFISQMVGQAGGYVNLEKLENKIEVELYFPVESEGIESELKPEIKVLQGKTVFIVEDDQALRNMIKASLKFYGALVLEASSESEARSLWQELKNHVDIVILDVVFPEGDGISLFQSMKADRPSLPALFISGYGESRLNQVLEYEKTRFLPKPFTVSKLIKTIVEFLSETDTNHEETS